MIASALTLGLSTGFFCLGTCAPVLMALFASSEESGLKHQLRGLTIFLTGRLIAYCLFGAASYAAGRALGDQGMGMTAFLPLGDVLLGGVMLIHASGYRLPHLVSCQTTSRWFRKHNLLFAAGFFTGVNLCPPFILALTQAMRSDSLLQSVAFFAVFFLTTSIYLLPFVLSGLAAKFAEMRAAARLACGMGGVWFMIHGSMLFAAWIGK